MTDKCVLVIDDDFEFMDGDLKRGLEKHRFKVIGETDPSKAVSRIKSIKPHMVLLDILFPEGKLGKPTLERIKNKYPNLPVVMITSTLADEEYRPEDYLLADYRYAKEALAEGNFDDLAIQLDRLINKAEVKEEDGEDQIGLSKYGFIVGKTRAMKEVATLVEKVAEQDQTVLITGEPGTGKELVAKAIHNLGRRKSGPFVAVNSRSIPDTLLESELFGFKAGAHNVAKKDKPGRFALAERGTLFLDEIGEMSQDCQVKVLRVLQEKVYEPLGHASAQPITADVRFLAATNSNLNEMIVKGRFREDLYFRINVVSIHILPLRERKEDIPLFFEHFVKNANEESKKNVLPILRNDVMEKFTGYQWPGNIRELENMIRRAVALADENILQVSNFPGLVEENRPTSELPSDVPGIVERIFEKEWNWENIKAEYAAKGEMRKKILLYIIDRWREKHGRRPKSDDLAKLLSILSGNMRRILSELGIDLTKLTK